MNESFLHYLWQFQYFEKKNLVSTSGERITVLKTGTANSNAGPDFSNAKIKIGEVAWAGNVEVHVKSSDWYAHKHQTDGAYNNVILHVVWLDDKPVVLADGSLLPTLELKERVDEALLKEYKKLVNSASPVACEKSFGSVEEIVKLSMLDKALLYRLETKAQWVDELLKSNTGDWVETTYQMMAKNFGFKVNAEPFFQLAKAVPYKTIQKQSSLLQVEALLFGQAGMLITKTKDDYISTLYREYNLLAQKYALRDTAVNYAQWRFLRLRPANFPTVRLAQLASVLFYSKNIFSKLIEANSFADVEKIVEVGQSAYWKTHYRFGPKAKGAVPDFGKASIQNIIINTVAPLLVAYGKYKDEQSLIDRAVELLQNTEAEQNKITRLWANLGLKVNSAFDSQALIELYNNFCSRRQCLNCNLGISILKPVR
jgi:hypothetical protein